jgi:hypothetical protein
MIRRHHLGRRPLTRDQALWTLQGTWPSMLRVSIHPLIHPLVLPGA